MTTLTRSLTIVSIYALLLTITFGYVLSQNIWALTHAKQVQMTRTSFEAYSDNWTIIPLKVDATDSK